MQTMERTEGRTALIQEVTFARVDCAFDTDTAVRIKEQLTPLLHRPGHVVLDLREARLDSAGLGALLTIQRRLEAQGRRLFVVNDDPGFRDLLERAEVADCLTLFDEADDAMAVAQRPC